MEREREINRKREKFVGREILYFFLSQDFVLPVNLKKCRHFKSLTSKHLHLFLSPLRMSRVQQVSEALSLKISLKITLSFLSSLKITLSFLFFSSKSHSNFLEMLSDKLCADWTWIRESDFSNFHSLFSLFLPFSFLSLSSFLFFSLFLYLVFGFFSLSSYSHSSNHVTRNQFNL